MEVVLRALWLLRQALSLQVCMEAVQHLVVHILSGLSFKNQPLRQQHQLVAHGTS
jgi:hypothetical protein